MAHDLIHDPVPPAPHTLRYFFNGMQIGEVSDDGNPDTDYAATAAQHLVATHELGHANYSTTSQRIGAWNDEFRASYWAAKNAPGLTRGERVGLLNDALGRAREAGVPVRSNQFMREL